MRHRTLMLILPPGSPLEPAREALLSAAATSPRPHVLVSFRSTHRQTAGLSPSWWQVARRTRPVTSCARLAPPMARAVAAASVARSSPKTCSGMWRAERAGSNCVSRDGTRRPSVCCATWLAHCSDGGHSFRRRRPSSRSVVLRSSEVVRGDADSIFAEAATHAQAAKEETRLRRSRESGRRRREPTPRN